MVKKPPTLTKEQSVCLEHEILYFYGEESFQRNLHEVWDQAGSDPLKQGRARQEACLPVQFKVISKYGFEASKLGVCQSVRAFHQYNFDFDEVLRGEFMSYLINPGYQRLIDDPNMNLSGTWFFGYKPDSDVMFVAAFSHTTGERHFVGGHYGETEGEIDEATDTHIWGSFVRWHVKNYHCMALVKEGRMSEVYVYTDAGEVAGGYAGWREAGANQGEQERQDGRPEERAPPVLLEHLDPESPLIYGGLMDSARAPSVFLRSPHRDETVALIQYVREDPEGPFAGLVDPWPSGRGVVGGR
eukprot:CAMPEP_0171189590 /NCGR_PEP_ID=MMETSP0790-20130122/18423_1 /TAXON_ID=2925 /ORGANISM="Alexandrium catenella, Strain OF101" /LENGTH=299 /DNA_ID=CAMNT_0011654703 /DNA_START=91 /DNA_END=987 /DNA_ORIENTATION=-